MGGGRVEGLGCWGLGHLGFWGFWGSRVLGGLGFRVFGVEGLEFCGCRYPPIKLELGPVRLLARKCWTRRVQFRVWALCWSDS